MLLLKMYAAAVGMQIVFLVATKHLTKTFPYLVLGVVQNELHLLAFPKMKESLY